VKSLRDGNESNASDTTDDMDPANFALWRGAILSSGESSGTSENATQSAVFMVDLETFMDFLQDSFPDVPIRSILTVTSLSISCHSACADTAECYVRSQWSHYGLQILDWLSQIRDRQVKYSE
jgi:hypothetical protein